MFYVLVLFYIPYSISCSFLYSILYFILCSTYYILYTLFHILFYILFYIYSMFYSLFLLNFILCSVLYPIPVRARPILRQRSSNDGCCPGHCRGVVVEVLLVALVFSRAYGRGLQDKTAQRSVGYLMGRRDSKAC